MIFILYRLFSLWFVRMYLILLILNLFSVIVFDWLMLKDILLLFLFIIISCSIIVLIGVNLCIVVLISCRECGILLIFITFITKFCVVDFIGILKFK